LGLEEGIKQDMFAELFSRIHNIRSISRSRKDDTAVNRSTKQIYHQDKTFHSLLIQ